MASPKTATEINALMQHVKQSFGGQLLDKFYADTAMKSLQGVEELLMDKIDPYDDLNITPRSDRNEAHKERVRTINKWRYSHNLKTQTMPKPVWDPKIAVFVGDGIVFYDKPEEYPSEVLVANIALALERGR